MNNDGRSPNDNSGDRDVEVEFEVTQTLPIGSYLRSYHSPSILLESSNPYWKFSMISEC
ncbi:hypothetical protein Phum_PHUM599840 [Pediculus humanus corporis]|uniref:Uncharacterized protein n=1 Tax=Pediculus humanus subsp. corporis TaxID=121224 RepID=E0W308_PEDHC|nr:uncharacterized protein Phum_PHUM599840 [Pediculus humanus corporis]EEB20014.1 hypothetical protein Phum_PHUM599840 [Pediculus humanus corporis]